MEFGGHFHRKAVWYVIGLLTVPFTYWLFILALRGVGNLLPNEPSLKMDFTHPLFWARQLFFIFSRPTLYLPVVFWVILWIRSRYTDPAYFPEWQMGWITTSLGVFSLGISWIFNDYRSGIGFQLSYGIGWCFLFTGPLCLAGVRSWIQRVSMGKIACGLGLGWIAFGLSGIKIGHPSVLLLIFYMISFVPCILGFLSMNKQERWLGFVGLLLLLIYSLFLRPRNAWFPILFFVEWLYTIPSQFLFFLAWSAALGWGLGIFKKWGHPLEVKTANNLR